VRCRHGLSLVELLLALVCSLLVLTLSLRALADLGVVVRRAATTSVRLQTARTTRVLLRTEVAASGPRGIRAVAQDSLALRVFRGAARVCPGAMEASGILVAPEGLRRAVPRKDSVLLLTPDGRWMARDLVSVSPTPDRCPLDPTLPMERWTVADPPEEAVLLRYFESGAYHISAGALRYRIGRSGRQPITGVGLEGMSFAFRGGLLSLGADGDTVTPPSLLGLMDDVIR
jgi:hypothetical protein